MDIQSLIFKVARRLHLSTAVYHLETKCNKVKVPNLGCSPFDALNRVEGQIENSCLCKPHIIEELYDLDIIVPVYNVEKYLRDCLNSILGQKTVFSFHVTVVDDGSIDSSAKILNEYENRTNITIIHQKNEGLSGARNTGLQYIYGRYLMFVDSDDFLMQGAIESLMKKAKETNADIVQGGYSIIKNGRISRNIIPSDDQLFGFAWGKVYKSNLWKTIKFPEKYWYEDTVCHLIIYPMASIKLSIHVPVFGYRSNQYGISQTSIGNPKAIDTLWITLQLLKDRRLLQLSEDNDYCRAVIGQISINANRISTLHDKTLDYANFLASKQILEKYCPSEIIERWKDNIIVNALRSDDFNTFYWWSRING